MSLPKILLSRIAEAKAALAQHPNSDLNLGYRQGIWAGLNYNMDAQLTRAEIGHKRRALLAIIAAERVIPIWERIWSIDDTPQCIIATARLLLNGLLDTNIARSYRDDNWQKLESLACAPSCQDWEYQKAVSVGLSSISALGAVLDDEQFDSEHIDYTLTDDEVDSYSSDASFWAAIAYSGSQRNPSHDGRKQREFWEWWLDEAVKNTWWSFDDDSLHLTAFPRQIQLISIGAAPLQGVESKES